MTLVHPSKMQYKLGALIQFDLSPNVGEKNQSKVELPLASYTISSAKFGKTIQTQLCKVNLLQSENNPQQ